MSIDRPFRRVVRCAVGKSQYCIETQYIQSIRQASAVRRSSSSEPNVAGYLGSDIPVFRLDHLLGAPDAPRADREHLLIVDTMAGPFGLVVGGLSKAMQIETHCILPLPSLVIDPTSSFFGGVVNFDDNTASRRNTDESHQVGQAIDSLALLLSPNGLFALTTDAPRDSFDAPPLRIRFNRAASQDGQLMLFGMPHVDNLGDALCLAFSVTQVLEVMQDTDFLAVPGAQRDVLGITKWRDHLVTVVDMMQLLGFETLPYHLRNRLAIIRRNDGTLIGFHSAANIRTLRFPLEAKCFANLPETVRGEYVLGSFTTQEEGILAIPAIDRFAWDNHTVDVPC